MAKYIKGNIAYQPVVEQINRKFVPKKQTCVIGATAGPVVLETKGWMGGATRTTNRGTIGEVRKNYLVVRQAGVEMSQSEDAINARILFAAVNKAIPTLLRDLTQLVKMQQLYKGSSADPTKRCNGVSANGYTFRGWVWAVQYTGKYEEPNYNLLQFPANYDA